MKKKNLFVLAASLLLLSCTSGSSSASGSVSSNASYNSGVVVSDNSGATTSISIASDSIASSFSLKNSAGVAISPNNGVYTITNADTYVASGKLEEGQIYVNAPSREVEVDLEGASISNSTVSPIFVEDCDKFVLKVKKDTDNYIYDTRTTDYSQSSDEDVGKAAVYVKNGDLKVNGRGTLSVTSNANSGLHSKDNVTVKNATLLVKAVNNGIKGADKVTIEENPTIGIVAGNNGIVTSNSDVGSSAQHGYIYVNGGTITINSYGDGIDAAYSAVFGTSIDDEGNIYSPTVDIYTNVYSSYSLSSSTSNKKYAGGGPGGGGFQGGGFAGGSSAEKADDSAKAIKAVQSIDVTAGNIYCYTYDDCLHTNNDTLESGSKGAAAINISGGTLNLKASDDAVHADGTLSISGGTINVIESHEGLEANIINLTGGIATVTGSDDGVNASSAINISGGRLDVSVSPNGDTDGIDSNGSVTITGGITITRGPNSEMAAPLDSDGTKKMTGGTLVVIGYYPASFNIGNLTKTSTSNGLSSGNHTITIGSETISYNNAYSYSGSVTVVSSASATVK